MMTLPCSIFHFHFGILPCLCRRRCSRLCCCSGRRYKQILWFLATSLSTHAVVQDFTPRAKLGSSCLPGSWRACWRFFCWLTSRLVGCCCPAGCACTCHTEPKIARRTDRKYEVQLPFLGFDSSSLYSFSSGRWTARTSARESASQQRMAYYKMPHLLLYKEKMWAGLMLISTFFTK